MKIYARRAWLASLAEPLGIIFLRKLGVNPERVGLRMPQKAAYWLIQWSQVIHIAEGLTL
ncbi:hypothetical protein BU251_00255 [Candidatus Velamenicoccus archaeovorus]|uniref:Uncharacterized protein n=1 Tax=Velamenicoccus archaeovorus TaxID=1930593 RepID=A0A410P2E0_VELA1|nr:hypothetical protein BU251_00255 [Candidatus Velamenicoccus archaeovorus]